MRKRNIAPAAAPVLIMFLLLTGCASSQTAARFQAFSTAVTQTTANVQGMFDDLEKKYQEVKMEKAVNEYLTKGRPPELDTRPVFPFKNIEVKIDLMGVLEKYAGLLVALTGGSIQTELDAKIKALDLSVKDLQKRMQESKNLKEPLFSDQQIDGVAAAADTLSRWIKELTTREAVKKEISQRKESVKTICGLLIDDIGTLKLDDKGSPTNGTGVRWLLWLTYQESWTTEKDYISEWCVPKTPIKKPGTSPSQGNGKWKSLDASCNRDEARRYYQIRAAWKLADDKMRKLQNSLALLAQSHDELLGSFAEEKKPLDEKLAAFCAEVNRIGAYYQSLQSGK